MNLNIEKVLITGAAGFIGSMLSKKFLDNNFQVLGVDSINDYYSIELKKNRLKMVAKSANSDKKIWHFREISLEDKDNLFQIFKNFEPDLVINLAAQAGVRYSIENPYAYAESNLLGFLNILEACRIYNIKHLIYASSSSVYGGNKCQPFKESDTVDHPVSFYAATKKSNEIMAHSYSHLYNLPSTGLRFFTVYGPWGRPDMAPMIFAKNIYEGKSINIYNNGNMMRDFTYIDDVVEAIFRCSFKVPLADKSFDFKNPDPSISFAPHQIFNVGNGNPKRLMEFIEILENCLNKKSKKNFLPMQSGDVEETFADINKLNNWINYRPEIDLETGVKKFVAWFLESYDNF